MAKTSSIPGMPFDTSKPFYPLVMNYLALIFGFKELVGFGAINRLRELSASNLQVDTTSIVESLLRECCGFRSGHDASQPTASGNPWAGESEV